jgi:HAD superfamily hydrolase (TIGR01509 family)
MAGLMHRLSARKNMMKQLSAIEFDDQNPKGSGSFEVVAFDCDGVLFDSKEANVRFYSHILERVGLPPIRPEQEEYVHMHPVRESLRYLVDEEQAFEEALNYVQSIDFKQFNACLRPEPGLVDLLEQMQIYYYIALATNRTISTRQVLAHFQIEKYFDLVVSASDVSFPKPHPEIMELIMNTFRVSPEQILFIGDSQVDEALAMATGVFFVAYKNPDLHAHLHISHFQELQPLLFSDTNRKRRWPG